MEYLVRLNTKGDPHRVPSRLREIRARGTPGTHASQHSGAHRSSGPRCSLCSWSSHPRSLRRASPWSGHWLRSSPLITRVDLELEGQVETLRELRDTDII